MDTPHLLIDPYVSELSALHDRTASEPAERDVSAIDAQCRALVARLVDAPGAEPPADASTWLATRTPEVIMVIGPGLFLLAEQPDGAVSLVSDDATWSFDRDDTGAFVSFTGDATHRSWNLLPDGTVQDRNDPKLLEARLDAARAEAAQAAFADERARFEGAAEQARAEERARADERALADERRRTEADARADAAVPNPPATAAPWEATHRVGAHALTVGGVPEGTLTPGAVLDPRLPVRLLGTSTEGWALVECSNEWRCYVAAWGIEPTEGVRGG